jgi:hypothetical protein
LFAELPLQIPSAHQPARAAAYDCKIKHNGSVVSGAPVSGITGRLSNPKKSAFQPEGKMNKAGSCTAARQECGKMANIGRRFRLGP